MATKTNKGLGGRLKQARIRAGLTPTEAAAAIGRATSTWFAYESGTRVPPRPVLRQIARVTGTNLHDLAGEAVAS